jgi:hypothetical protein
MKRKIIWLFIMALLISPIMVICGCTEKEAKVPGATSNTTPISTPSPVFASTPVPTPTSSPILTSTPVPTPKIGDVVSGDIWQVKVVSTRKDITLKRSTLGNISSNKGSYSANEGYLFLTVEVQIINISTIEQMYDSRSISLIDSDKLLYLPKGKGDDGENFDLDLTYWTMRPVPGKTSSLTSYYIVFIVPKDAKGFYFRFQDMPAIDLGI